LRTRAKRSRNIGTLRSRRSRIRATRVRNSSWTTAATPPCSSTRVTKLENGDNWVNTPSDNHEIAVIKALLKRVAKERPGFWHTVVKDWKGVSEETTTGVHRLYR